MRSRQVVGLAGAAIAMTGAFARVMRVPIMGGVSLMKGSGGYILLAVAAWCCVWSTIFTLRRTARIPLLAWPAWP